MIFFFQKSCIQVYVSRDEDFFFLLFFASSFSSLKKKGQIRARRDEGDLVICGHGFSSFPFPLFHDKSELVPIFSFSLVILCLIKTYFHPGFLAKQARMSLPMRFCFHYKRISICKRVYCTEQPMEQNSMPNRRSSVQQKWGHDNTWDLVEKKKMT